jgi:hypothetical protein
MIHADGRINQVGSERPLPPESFNEGCEYHPSNFLIAFQARPQPESPRDQEQAVTASAGGPEITWTLGVANAAVRSKHAFKDNALHAIGASRVAEATGGDASRATVKLRRKNY